MAEKTHKAECFCGAVQLSLTGTPKAQGFCHCSSCRTWAGAPINSFTLWDPAQVSVTRGESMLVGYTKNPTSIRKFCKSCGGHVISDHPSWNVVDVSAALLPTLEFAPTVHVNYGEKIVAMRDGLPKMKDFPKEMGGSGETLPE